MVSPILEIYYAYYHFLNIKISTTRKRFTLQFQRCNQNTWRFVSSNFYLNPISFTWAALIRTLHCVYMNLIMCLMSSHQNLNLTSNDLFRLVDFDLIDKCIRNLKLEKDCGQDELSAEHLVHARPSLVIHLCFFLFRAMILHGFYQISLVWD